MLTNWLYFVGWVPSHPPEIKVGLKTKSLGTLFLEVVEPQVTSRFTTSWKPPQRHDIHLEPFGGGSSTSGSTEVARDAATGGLQQGRSGVFVLMLFRFQSRRSVPICSSTERLTQPAGEKEVWAPQKNNFMLFFVMLIFGLNPSTAITNDCHHRTALCFQGEEAIYQFLGPGSSEDSTHLEVTQCKMRLKQKTSHQGNLPSLKLT